MITQSDEYVRIPIKEWKQLKESPVFSELIELLEDQRDLYDAKKVRGKDLSVEEYFRCRGVQHTP